MDYGLFFFADDQAAGRDDGYRLLLDCARLADERDLTAVWTPERHFHRFGGPYPNSAVTGAAVAAVTERVAVRAGSVVAPLHHPVRIAEEWAVVDNLSGGRVGLSFASGWHARDFVLRPQAYTDRKQVMVEAVETVRALWRGESLALRDGSGTEQSVQTFPRPVQAELPVWVTSAGSVGGFRTAGRLGAGVLTHLLGQDLAGLASNIACYREESERSHGDGGHVVLMLHTALGADRDAVRERVRRPLEEYLRSSADLAVRASGQVSGDLGRLPARDQSALLQQAFNRYFETAGLFGTVADAVRTAESLTAVGVDEIACLVDFGLAHEEVLVSIEHLAELADVGRRTAPSLAAG